MRAMEESTKTIFESKTFWGGAVAVAATVLNWFGFDLWAGFTEETLEHFYALVTAGAALFAIYGRVVATKKIE